MKLSLNLQEAALSTMYLDRYLYYLEQQQSLTSLSVQERSTSAATEFTAPTDTANSNTSSSNQYQGHRIDIQPQQFLPGLSRQQEDIPAETDVSRSSARQSSDTDSGLTAPSCLVLQTARPTQQSPFQPAPVSPTMPEQQEMDVAHSQVSNSSRLVILIIIVTYGGVEV
jgi:hypothetical protein